jgi:hypothetical protein
VPNLFGKRDDPAPGFGRNGPKVEPRRLELLDEDPEL